MAFVPIPKDLKKVKTKVAFNLTKRQLIGFSIAGLVGIPTYLALKNVLPNDVSIMVMVGVTLPIFFITLFDKDGLSFEKYFKYIYITKFYQPSKRIRKEKYIEQKRKAREEARNRKKKIKTKPKRNKKTESKKKI